MSAGGTAASRLERTLLAHAARSGVTLAIADARSTRWASATFVGARHHLALTLSGAAAQDWLAGLDEADLPLPGHLVADLVVRDQRHGPAELQATVEVLTVEDS